MSIIHSLIRYIFIFINH